MADNSSADDQQPTAEPRGFGEHSRGLAGEYAHEQGWQLNEDERRKQPAEKQNTDGGTDYEYGARDFGEAPVDTSGSPSASEQVIAQAREALLKED